MEKAEECFGALFGTVDRHPDSELSLAEISRLFRILTYFVTASPDGATELQVAGAITAMIPVAPIISKAIVSSLDYDNNGMVSLDEFSADRLEATNLTIFSQDGMPAEAQNAVNLATGMARELLPMLLGKELQSLFQEK